jgi:hypothetical protein
MHNRFRKRWNDKICYKTGSNISVQRALANTKENVEIFHKLLSSKIEELGKTEMNKKII